jgi:hypothetical protein
VVEKCDCYNYCAGDYLSCCAYGEFCGLNCQNGPLVAGCKLDPNGGPSPTPAPLPGTKAPTPKQPFFFWPDNFFKAPPPQEYVVAAEPSAMVPKQPFFFWPDTPKAPSPEEYVVAAKPGALVEDGGV